MTGVLLPLAHLGHWYVSLPIFMGPVLLLFGWVYVGDWLEKRRRGRKERAQAAASSSSASSRPTRR